MKTDICNPHNLEQCIKCAICTEVCPVLKVIPEIYPGPKKSGPDSERLRLRNSMFFDKNLKFCLGCKRCETVCPSDVRIADIIRSARKDYGHVRVKLRDAILAGTDRMGSLATPISPVVNAVTGNSIAKGIMDITLGIDHRRTFPQYASEKFTDLFKRTLEARQSKYTNRVSYFHGCYVNYNYPQLGVDFVDVMNAVGYGVDLVKDEKCCGIAMISSGMYSSAEKNALENISAISESCKDGRSLLTTSTSCTLTMRDEYRDILGLDNSRIRDSIVLVEKFLSGLIEDNKVTLSFKKRTRLKLAYHVPCHLERLGWSCFTLNLLRRIPGVDLTVLDSGCCGMAGTYGFKKENYTISQKIGEPLFKQIREVNPDYVISECETCKWQIEMSTGYKVLNPISLLAMTLDLRKTAKDNR